MRLNFKRTEKSVKSRKTDRVSLTIVFLDCKRKTLIFRLFYVFQRLFQNFQSKNVCKHIEKKEKKIIF